jgi:hypothetical protein
MAREGVSLNVIQRQLGHANLGITSVYLEGIDAGEIIETVHGRRAPLVPAVTALGHDPQPGQFRCHAKGVTLDWDEFGAPPHGKRHSP